VATLSRPSDIFKRLLTQLALPALLTPMNVGCQESALGVLQVGPTSLLQNCRPQNKS
jgi:hypothetical protein